MRLTTRLYTCNRDSFGPGHQGDRGQFANRHDGSPFRQPAFRYLATLIRPKIPTTIQFRNNLGRTP